MLADVRARILECSEDCFYRFGSVELNQAAQCLLAYVRTCVAQRLDQSGDCAWIAHARERFERLRTDVFVVIAEGREERVCDTTSSFVGSRRVLRLALPLSLCLIP